MLSEECKSALTYMLMNNLFGTIYNLLSFRGFLGYGKNIFGKNINSHSE